MSIISINYGILNEEGNNILDLCIKYDDFIKKGNKILNELKNNWQSQAGIIFQNKLEEMIKTIESDKEKLEVFGNLIIKVRREFKENEDNFCKDFKNDFSESLEKIGGDSFYE